MEEYAALPAEQQAELSGPFEEFQRQLSGMDLAAVIRDAARRFEDRKYPEILSKLEKLVKPDSGDGGQSQEQVAITKLNVGFNKPWLADEEDVEDYLKALRAALIEQIKNDKRIRL